MLPVATRQDAPRTSPSFTESVQPFPPEFAHLLTPPVLAASAAHQEAREALMHRRATLGAARDAVGQARAADAADARDAVTIGNLPTPATEPKAADELQRVERAVAAAEEIARASQAAFLAAVRDHIAELHRAVRERQAQIRDQANEALDLVYAALTERDALNELLRELDINGIAGRNPTFKPLVPHRRRDLAAEQLAGIRELLAVDPAAGNRFTGPTAA